MHSTNDTPAAARCARLAETVPRHLAGGRITVAPYREGVDCWVDLVRSDGTPIAVVRSAKTEVLRTSYEGKVDFRDTVEKELCVARLLSEAEVPTPAVLSWHLRCDQDHPLDFSWIAYEFVPHDTCEVLPETLHQELGAITSRIHAIRPGSTEAVTADRSEGWDTHVITRILHRLSAAARYMDLPPLDEIQHALSLNISGREAVANALLHLDLRAPNLAIVDGRITAVMDLSNAIVGDPGLELARLRCCGLLTERFWQGYGQKHWHHPSLMKLLDAYELDIAALLVVVSREEFSDPELHDNMKNRTRELLMQLGLGTRPVLNKEGVS